MSYSVSVLQRMEAVKFILLSTDRLIMLNVGTYGLENILESDRQNINMSFLPGITGKKWIIMKFKYCDSKSM